MIPVKDTRELLYKLLKAEYVQIQEVSRTSDHAPSRTFFLWRVDLARAIENVGEIYQFASELCQASPKCFAQTN
jgi:DNA-directed RNA polymerase III subunit RPC3|tara:strand:- start:2058 stop:2279 length:222 start_codon:yes stop_codon:yes gene_type:complete